MSTPDIHNIYYYKVITYTKTVVGGFAMSNSQVCKFKFKNGSKSFRLNIRYYPADSKEPGEIMANFVDILRYALGVSLSE